MRYVDVDIHRKKGKKIEFEWNGQRLYDQNAEIGKKKKRSNFQVGEGEEELGYLWSKMEKKK